MLRSSALMLESAVSCLAVCLDNLPTAKGGHWDALLLLRCLSLPLRPFILSVFRSTCVGCIWASLVPQTVKSLPAAREIWAGPWVGKIPWRRAWQSTPGFLPGESHGERSLVAAVYGVAKG